MTKAFSLQAEYAARFPNDAIQIIERAITSECARYEALQKKGREPMSKSIALALVEAQKNMTKATKQANNPHLRSKYADLGSVMDACLPALNDAGIAVIQPAGEDESGRYVETVMIHGESGEQLSCKVPLIVQKNDMQGYGSAVTYARRYGLMTMAGIAPEDDDGNAAAKAPPRQGAQARTGSRSDTRAARRTHGRSAHQVRKPKRPE